MKKVVLKLELHDDKAKQKAMKKVSGISGVESIAMDIKDHKLTVTGEIDPVTLVAKLRKICRTELVTVGPAKEPEKKKDEQPAKKDDSKNKADDKNKDAKDKNAADMVAKAQQAYYNQYQAYYNQYPGYYSHQPPPATGYYHARPVEEDHNNCVIC